MCQPRKHLARIFFPAHCTCVNFFLDNSLVQEIFSYAHALAGYFFSKSPNPPPPQKLNGWPLITPRSMSTRNLITRRVLSTTSHNLLIDDCLRFLMMKNLSIKQRQSTRKPSTKADTHIILPFHPKRQSSPQAPEERIERGR